MTKSIQIDRVGGPEALRLRRVRFPDLRSGEALIRHSYVGVNYIDVYHRTGLYPLPALPATLGVDGVGVVEAIGEGVREVRVGDRCVYALPVGSYAERRIIPADRLIALPAEVSDEAAAAMMLRGLTAHMLLHRVYPVAAGTTVLIHAAAGGLGQLLTQWAKLLGAEVIGTVGSEAKAEVARAAGADHVIPYRTTDFAGVARNLTGGRGVEVAYDGVGGTNLARTFDAVRTFGTVVSVGQAGGSIPPIDVAQLGPTRSLSLSRPSIRAYAAEPDTYKAAAAELLRLLASRRLMPAIGAIYPLQHAARAHHDLESGQTIGSILLAA